MYIWEHRWILTKGQRSRSHRSFQFWPSPLCGFVPIWLNHFICGIHTTHEGTMYRAPFSWSKVKGQGHMGCSKFLPCRFMASFLFYRIILYMSYIQNMRRRCVARHFLSFVRCVVPYQSDWPLADGGAAIRSLDRLVSIAYGWVITALAAVQRPSITTAQNGNSVTCGNYPDSKVHGANMGPTWVLSVPDGPHIGPMNLAIRVVSNDVNID